MLPLVVAVAIGLCWPGAAVHVLYVVDGTGRWVSPVAWAGVQAIAARSCLVASLVQYMRAGPVRCIGGMSPACLRWSLLLSADSDLVPPWLCSMGWLVRIAVRCGAVLLYHVTYVIHKASIQRL